MQIADGALGGGTKVAELTFTPKNDVSSNTTAILCGAAGVPVEVGYGLVAPLASVDMTLTVVVGKRDDTTDDRTLSANLSQITWKRGHTHENTNNLIQPSDYGERQYRPLDGERFSRNGRR